MSYHPVRYVIQEVGIQNDLLQLRLVPAQGTKIFNFQPGQYVTLRFTEGQGHSFERAFSIASSPTNKDYLEFDIRTTGNFTKHLAKLAPGSEIEVRGPFGNFVYDPREQTNTILIAGGIGITPFLSMVRFLRASRLANRVTLLFSNKTLADTPYFDELQQISKQLTNFSVYFFVTGEKAPAQLVAPNIFYQRLDANFLSQRIAPAASQQQFYLCGPASFMDAIREQLIGLNVDEINIHQEDFAWGPPKIRKSDILFYLGSLGVASAITIALLIAINRVETSRTLAAQNSLPNISDQLSSPSTTPSYTPNYTPPSYSSTQPYTTSTPRVVPRSGLS